jgi:hypothetical protein
MGAPGHGRGDDDVDSLVLAPDPASVRVARRFVADNCSKGPAPEDLRDTAVLLVSELVGDAADRPAR